MVLPKIEYIRAQTLAEASNLMVELGKGAKIMNGGTDLLPPMNDGVLKPTHLVDIKNIPGLDYITYDEKEGLKIGALTKLREIEFSPVVREKNPAVASAAAYVASMQVRAKGTMAGNITNASPSNDTGPILLAQNAKVLVHRHDGKETEIPMDKFYIGFKQTALETGDIITALVIPPLAKGEHAAYIKHSVRRAMDLAIVGVAAWIKLEGNKCVDARIALGGVSISTIRAPAAEDLLKGKEITDELLEKVGIAAMNSCKPISDVRASAEYRSDMVRVFTKRVIKKALEVA
ncbi:dehydrogenase [Spirochaetia bacterium]|nr:dehydrogenase [Spirochaetia bacterium]